MSRLSYSEVKSLMASCPYSHLEQISSERHIVLPPKFMNCIKTGLVEQLNSEMHFTTKWTDGVLIAYNNVRVIDRVGRIFEEAPFIHFNIKADFIVFRPTIGCHLIGTVNKKSPNHVGCLVHQCFNASIHRPHNYNGEWKGTELQIGEEFVFVVTKIFVHNGVMSLRGNLCDESFNIKTKSAAKGKKNKMSDKSSQEEENNVSEEEIKTIVNMSFSKKGDNSDSLSNNDSGIEDISLSNSKKKKKKKKKESDNEKEENDFNPETLQHGQNHKADTIKEEMDISLFLNESIGKGKKKNKQVKRKLEDTYSPGEIENTIKHMKVEKDTESVSFDNTTHSKHKKKRIKEEPDFSFNGNTHNSSVIMSGNSTLDTTDTTAVKIKKEKTESVKIKTEHAESETTPWGRKETEKLYKAVKEFGTDDWSTIANGLKTPRTNSQIKHKWKSVKKDKSLLKTLQDKYGSL